MRSMKNRNFIIFLRKHAVLLAFAVLLLLTAACSKEQNKIENEEPVIPVTGITLNNPAALLLVDYTLTLEATIEPAEATNKTVTWSTDNESIATVNSAGEVTAVASGTAIIKAATAGGFTATHTVTVATTGITMTTQASEVYLDIGGTDILIDWGDGVISNLLPYDHSYASSAEHRITITGDIATLYCYNNQLTALDVSGNMGLWYLDCHDNQLTSLDVSNCTALGCLCVGYNPLTILDVSNMTELVSLAADNCQLNTLHFDNCTKLEQVWCHRNQLTSLDVRTNVELRMLACGVNLLSADALNDLFRGLPYMSEHNPYWEFDCPLKMSVINNPGADDCNYSIAEEKGWCQSSIRGPYNMKK